MLLPVNFLTQGTTGLSTMVVSAVTGQPKFVFSHPVTSFLLDDSHVANWQYNSDLTTNNVNKSDISTLSDVLCMAN